VRIPVPRLRRRTDRGRRRGDPAALATEPAADLAERRLGRDVGGTLPPMTIRVTHLYRRVVLARQQRSGEAGKRPAAP
jgi:hypothetical protein